MSKKDEDFRKKQEQMPDNQLIELAKDETHKLCKTGGKSLTMCVPPQVTDTDMILCELIRRYENLVARAKVLYNDGYQDGADDAANEVGSLL